MVYFKNGNIYYSYQDFFELSASPTIVTDDSLRLQIINRDDKIIINKNFSLQDTDILPTGQYIIQLSESESELLKLDNIYKYRLSFINSEQQPDTRLSGELYIEW